MININTIEEFMKLIKDKEDSKEYLLLGNETYTYSNLNIDFPKKCRLNTVSVRPNIIFKNCIINNLSISLEINNLIFDNCTILNFDITDSEICDTLIFFNCNFEKPNSVEIVDTGSFIVNSNIYTLFFKGNKYNSKYPNFRRSFINTLRILDEKIDSKSFLSFYCFETSIDTIQVDDIENYKILEKKSIKNLNKILIEDAAENVKRYNVYKFDIPKYKTATLRYEEEEPEIKTGSIEHYLHPNHIFPVSLDVLTIYYNELLNTVKIYNNMHEENITISYEDFYKLAYTSNGLNEDNYSSIFYLYYYLRDVIHKDKKYFELYNAFLNEEVEDWEEKDSAKNIFNEYDNKILCWYRESYLRKHFILICNYIDRVKDINMVLENIEERY